MDGPGKFPDPPIGPGEKSEFERDDLMKAPDAFAAALTLVFAAVPFASDIKAPAGHG